MLRATRRTTGQRASARVVRLLFVLVASVVLMLTKRAAAQSSSLELAWTAPPECPDRAWLESAVLHLVTTPPAQPLKVVGSVRESGGRWVVDLEFQGAASGKRTLSAASCGSVSRGAALIIALTLDPQASPFGVDDPAAASPPSPPSPPTPSPPSPPPPLPSSPSSPPSEPPSPRSSAENTAEAIRPLVFAGVGAGRAYLPGTAFGIVAGGGFTWRALRVDLSAEVEPTVSEAVAGRATMGADFSLAAVALRPCLGRDASWIALYGCAALRGIRIAGEGTGLAEAQHQTAHLLALEPGVLVRFPSRARFGLELDGTAAIPLARPDFVILTNGPIVPVYRVSSLGARLMLGVGVRF